MTKKSAKSTRKFAKSGELQRTIKERHKHQKVKKQIQSRKGSKTRPSGAASSGNKGKEKAVQNDDDAESEDDESDGGSPSGPSKFNGMSVDDFLGGGFLDGENEEEPDDDGEDESGQDDDDDASFASIDDLEDEGEAHRMELSALAEKDPEFYKYLQENDKELLEFQTGPKPRVEQMDNDDEDVEMSEEEEDAESGDDAKAPLLTSDILRKWQKALLEKRSLRALRKLLVAFRSAAHMNEEEKQTGSVGWSIDSPSVFNKLVVTAFKYTPVVLQHHIPYKTLPNGKFKSPTQNQKLKALQRLILSYFQNLIHLVSQLSDADMLVLALNESAKAIPYVISSRKAVKDYLKMCFNLWSTAEDNVRVAAFLAIRRVASASDEAILDLVLKGTYLALVRACKTTSIHTLPSINLMKNTACEVYCSDHAAAYQHAFGYVRQLAVHLRNSTKVKTKDAYRQVYNWQFVHCVDFWSIVLAKACDVQREAETGVESDLKPLIYPLVQVTLGAIKLISTARYYPLHFHLIRSLLHLIRHTKVYIPLAPYLLPMITTAVSPTGRPKPSTLRPLDLHVHIRVPAQYLKTRVYLEGYCEEAVFLLAEWCESVQGSIAFPEVTVPLTVVLRKCVKKAGSNASGKVVATVKGLIERIEDGSKWVLARREGVKFAPGMMDEVDNWENDINLEETPFGKWLKVLRKAREKKRQLVEKARDGEGEVLED